MISFNGFLENKKAENTIRECANLLAERDVDPYVYIYESLKEIDPVLAESWWACCWACGCCSLGFLWALTLSRESLWSSKSDPRVELCSFDTTAKKMTEHRIKEI